MKNFEEVSAKLDEIMRNRLGGSLNLNDMREFNKALSTKVKLFKNKIEYDVAKGKTEDIEFYEKAR